MRIDELRPGRLEEAVSLITRRQAVPDTHVAYLSSSSEAIAAELVRLEPAGLGGVLIAVGPDGSIAGLLGAEHDEDPPRVWWFGPFVSSDLQAGPVSDRLYEAARSRLPQHVRQEELACDDRSHFLPAFARRHGFVSEEPSALLDRSLDWTLDADTAGGASGAVRVKTPTTRERAVAAHLHDALFPGTHSNGLRALRVEVDRVALVAVEAGEVLGYAVGEVEADRIGYLDFLGVAEAARGRRIGGRLVAELCRALHADHGCPSVHLTVRVSNAAARRLYARLGFREERLLRPWRRGFPARDHELA